MNTNTVPEAETPKRRPSLADVILAMRPNQWTKNAVVLAAFFFGFWDRSQHLQFQTGLQTALLAAAVFCVVSSGVYLLNDVRDLQADRAHPRKRFRPIAAGRISPVLAVGMAILLLAVGLAAAWRLAPAFAGVAAIYVVIQLLYSLGLKRVALLDVFVIATGFVLRAIAGAVVLDVDISAWLLLCTFLLALFLALCKRRHEKLLVEDAPALSRTSLEQYDERLLDLLIAIVAGATIVSYSIYTLTESTVAKFGTNHLGFTIPFVIFGIFRYLDLAYRLEKGERPEMVLVTDLPILADIALYGITLLLIFCYH
ncbi:MAG: decaprenyl-phosphate phosphoribosyltransferase [Lentisphaerae bacterium]|nr:decaprenyl-phosphate phosphoribosyltransferase [Lentisphaerota bacterium]